MAPQYPVNAALKRRGRESSTVSTLKRPCVYILASRKYGTLYIGVTGDPVKRDHEHGSDVLDGFTKKYAVHALVWFEMHDGMEQAIVREKRLKKWRRSWKLRLIEDASPARRLRGVIFASARRSRN